MTGQKIDEGAKQRELEVADQCEYKRYLLLPPTCSLSHDGERQAWAEADVPPGKENEFWITRRDHFPELLWSPARTRAGDQQAGPPRKTGLRSSLEQLSAHKGVYWPCIWPACALLPGPCPSTPRSRFPLHPKRSRAGIWKRVSEVRLNFGCCWGFVFARRLGGEVCISRLFLNLDFWNLIWKNTTPKTRNPSHGSPVALGVLFRWLATPWSGGSPKSVGLAEDREAEGFRQFQKASCSPFPVKKMPHLRDTHFWPLLCAGLCAG